jgi:hypothetical protein
MVQGYVQDQLPKETLGVWSPLRLRHNANDGKSRWTILRLDAHRSWLGETPDISEYLDFGFYDWVWFKRDAGIGEIEIGKWLGVSKSTGSLMSYYALPITGTPVSRTTVQRVTELEKQTEANQQRIAAYDTAIAGRFKEGRLVTAGGKPDLAAWSKLLETDPNFAEEFAQTFDNPSVPEADDEFDPDSYDSYLNMELALERDDTTLEFAKVTKRMKDAAGNPIGVAHDNPILDARLYEVEYLDGHKAAISANIIAENILAQVDHDGHRQMLFEAIMDHHNEGTALQGEKASIKNSSGVSRNVETTKGWECLIQWHNGSTTWNKMKDVKDSYPVQLAEYAVENALEQEPVFRWWVACVLKKRERIIKKVKSSYWAKTHKYGFEVPKTHLDCIHIDKESKDTQWQDAVKKEMKTARPAFEIHEGEIKALVGYQQI